MSQGARFQAALNGETRYVSEKPCKRGHTGERMTSTGTCIECRKIKEKERYCADTKKAILKVTNYYKRNAEKIKEKRRDRYAKNSEKELALARERSAKWRAANPDKVALQKDLKRNYKKANPHKMTADLAKRRAAKKQRTPSWLTKKDLVMIETFYKLANEKTLQTGFVWHVDHIVPLQGKLVSGLHVPQNLRVIPWNENLSKGNKLLEVT